MKPKKIVATARKSGRKPKSKSGLVYRTGLSIDPQLFEAGVALANTQGFPSFSSYIAHLIERDKRNDSTISVLNPDEGLRYLVSKFCPAYHGRLDATLAQTRIDQTAFLTQLIIAAVDHLSTTKASNPEAPVIISPKFP